MDELKKELKEKFDEELNDATSYLSLSERAKELSDTYLARGLCEIAKDEYTHIRFLRDYLLDSGVEITTEEETKWTIVKDRMRHKFR